MRTQDITRDQWVTMIAEKVGKEFSEVDTLLKRHGIEARVTRPIPRRLLIESVSINGEKTGEFETKEISFSRTEMGPGLYAMVSDDNLKGKTTLLKIIRWMLTGLYDLPADMVGWLHTVTLGFKIDDQRYEVSVESVSESVGTLSSFARGKTRRIASFSDASTFRSVMEDFFLTELKLEPLIAVADINESGVEQRHGWNWLFSATVIDPAPDVLFGTDTTHGKPLRMMQMYLGIPWVLTRADLMAAQKRLTIDAKAVGRTTREMSSSAEKRLSELRAMRETFAEKVKTETSIADLRHQSSDALSVYMQSASDVRKLTPIVNEAQQEFDAAEAAVSESIRRHQEFLETQAAGRVFRKLRPICCPSCEEVYSEEYREEKEKKHDCMVCGRHDAKETEATVEIEAAFASDVEDAKAEKTRRRKHLGVVKAKLTAAISKRDDADRRNQRLEKDLGIAQSSTGAEIEVVKVDAQIAELERMIHEKADVSNWEIDVLQKAVELTKELYEGEQAEILVRVSEMTAMFARSFGMTDLVDVKLKGNTTMDVQMMGGKKTFGKCEPGERMRLKVAATLALIQVSEERGIGSHPGVLFVDSVANNEVTDKDVTEIVKGFQGLRETLPDVQVFISGISSAAILDHVPCENVIKNREDGYLW
ncbi:MAG: hypothetical protein VR78_11715 [Hoeflea sp. BRH_c9]|nr:MAG: hypothetical protein VR78_11715 [Hoeflea sp. BRH_c9]